MRTQKSKIFKALVITSIFIALLAGSKKITNPIRVNATNKVSPIFKSFGLIKSFVKRIIPFAAAKEENRRLEGQVDLLSQRIEELSVVSNENDRLRTLLDFKKSIPYATIPSQVIGRDPTNWSNSLIINKGASSGIKDNSAVLYTKGLAGRVVELGKYSAKVLLVTDPNSKIGVVISRNRQGGILVGMPDGMCKVVYIALDSDVIPGDKVITAGYGSIFPKDIMVGEVVKVGKEPGRLYKYAVVSPAEDLSRLEEVLCTR